LTVRALLIGLFGAVLIAALVYLNDHVLHMESFTAGHLLPVGVFVVMLVGAAAVKLVWFRRPERRFRAGELAVILMLLLVPCSIVSRGLLRTFTPTLVLPRYWYRQEPGWQKYDLMDYVPPALLAETGPEHPEVLDDFVSGKRTSDEHIALGDVPWAAWRRPLAAWLPVIVLTTVSMTCLGLIVHRQWAYRERLRYPIATFASSMLSGRLDGGGPSLFRNRPFWIGLAVVFAIHLINGFHAWEMIRIRIPMTLDFTAVTQKWPGAASAPRICELLQPKIYFTAIAFSFFLASDIVLSLGLSHLLGVIVGGMLIARGMDLREWELAGGATAWHRFGAGLAFVLIFLYAGRRHYGQVLKGAFLPGSRAEGAGPHEIWDCRFLFLAQVGLVAWIVRLGLDWPLAILTVGLLMLTFVIISRISAETGLFIVQPRWQAWGVLLGLLGIRALGPEALIITAMLCAVLSVGAGQVLMPYLVNGLKVCSDAGVRPGRVGRMSVAVYVLCLAVAIPAVLWANYNFGMDMTQGHEAQRVPTMALRAAAREMPHLALAGRVAESEGLRPLQRLTEMRPDNVFLWAAGSGFVLVLLFSAMRLRFTWWPLHPVLFLVVLTYPLGRLHFSFLLGWVIKKLVTTFGGRHTYQNLKPLMIGVVAGDMLGTAFFMVGGWVYYAVHGFASARFLIVFPRG